MESNTNYNYEIHTCLFVISGAAVCMRLLEIHTNYPQSLGLNMITDDYISKVKISSKS